jgi:hypothetical protein
VAVKFSLAIHGKIGYLFDLSQTVNVMNFRCTTAIVAALFFAATTDGADKRTKTPKLPDYPNQPHINAALKNLTSAQEQLERDRPKAILFLKKAQIALDGAGKNKGSYIGTATRLTRQAITHFEKAGSDPEMAATVAHEVAEAIEACHEAGKVGARKKR